MKISAKKIETSSFQDFSDFNSSLPGFSNHIIHVYKMYVLIAYPNKNERVKTTLEKFTTRNNYTATRCNYVFTNFFLATSNNLN